MYEEWSASVVVGGRGIWKITTVADVEQRRIYGSRCQTVRRPVTTLAVLPISRVARPGPTGSPAPAYDASAECAVDGEFHNQRHRFPPLTISQTVHASVRARTIARGRFEMCEVIHTAPRVKERA